MRADDLFLCRYEATTDISYATETKIYVIDIGVALTGFIYFVCQIMPSLIEQAGPICFIISRCTLFVLARLLSISRISLLQYRLFQASFSAPTGYLMREEWPYLPINNMMMVLNTDTRKPDITSSEYNMHWELYITKEYGHAFIYREESSWLCIWYREAAHRRSMTPRFALKHFNARQTEMFGDLLIFLFLTWGFDLSAMISRFIAQNIFTSLRLILPLNQWYWK